MDLPEILDFDTAHRLRRAFGITGYDIFVIPADMFGKYGEAFTDDASRAKCINIFYGGVDVTLSNILLHEVGHHVLGHVGVITTEPNWSKEYGACNYALDLIAFEYSYEDYYRAREINRAYIRPWVLDFVTADIFNHGEIDVAIWAGVDLPSRLAFCERAGNWLCWR